ncbi:MAG: chromate efflux transporter [Pseudomonadota bacterium]
MSATAQSADRAKTKSGETAPPLDASSSRAQGGADRPAGSAAEVFWVFLRLGLTSFGGPVAHLGYFREEFVRRRRWLSDEAYADLVALCQFMPGPASSQVGLGVGLSRAGGLGALAAWTGFTLPSAIALILFAYGLGAFGGAEGAGWIAGLKAAAVAVVALAVWGMAGSLAPDRARGGLALGAAALMLLTPFAASRLGVDAASGAAAIMLGQIAVIALGAGIGLVFFRGLVAPPAASDAAGGLSIPISRRVGAVSLVVFFALLIGLPWLAASVGSETGALAMLDAYFRAGALVFGGGHVVLPLLEASTVDPGWVSEDAFVAGYGAAQAVPGPLFTFAAFLGAAAEPSPTGALGGALALVAIFLPSAFLVVGLLPFWASLRAYAPARAALTGVNAAVLGLLIAALYDPVFTSGVDGPATAALALLCGLALGPWRAPPWAVVIGAALAGAGLGAVGAL